MSSHILKSARRVLLEHRAALDGRDPSLVHLPGSASLDLHRALALSAKASIRQIIAVSSEGLDPEAFEHVVWREAVRAGKRCERVYMIPHAGFAASTLQTQLNADRHVGIVSKCVIVSRIPFDSQLINTVGLWVLDDSAAVFAREDSRLGTRGSLQWTVSIRPPDVDNALASWCRVWSLADETEREDTLDLEEPLVLTADLLNGVAPLLCTNDHIDETSCHWYHGTWQYLRLLQLVSTPTWHHDFYRRALSDALLACESPSAIITGTADYSMLAYLAESFRQTKRRTSIHVLDHCATPLFACRWYAKRQHFDIVAYEDDILAFAANAQSSFDLLCTDAFLTRFPGSRTQEVLSAWHRLLRRGGKLVTTVRVHQHTLSARDPESAIRDFRDRATERVKRWEPFLLRSAVEIGQAAEIYARTMKSFAVGDETQIQNLFQSSGFDVNEATLGEVPGELYPTVYLRLVCTRQ